MTHQAKVREIATFLRQKDGENLSLKKASVSHQVPINRKHPNSRVDVSKLTDILSIDPVHKIAVAEGGVTFSDIVKETLKHGLVPYVVPELKSITLGGAVSGCSIESMSYKVGGFHDTCIEYEIITSNGEVIVCNKDTNSDVFNMVHGAFGTLGIVSKITFRLCPAKPNVKLSYHNYSSINEFLAAIKNEYDSPKHDFMDGIIHGPKQFVLVLADFVNEPPYLSDYSGQKVYYKSTAVLKEDYLSTYDYFFRFDRECHWISRNYGLENPLIRRLLGKKLLGSSNMLKLAKRYEKLINLGRPLVTVDTMMAFSKFEQFYRWYHKEFSYYPIWIVPYNMPNLYPWINPKFLQSDDRLYIDLAIYGMRQRGDQDNYLKLDKELLEFHGIKTLISLNQYKPETFWAIYDKRAYEAVKQRVDPAHKFPDLYKKTNSDPIL